MKKKLHTPQRAEVPCDLSVTKPYDTIKLGIDWHARHFRVVRIIDNAGPEPAQRFSPQQFLIWARKQLGLARQVHSCYEAGAGGFVLHRQLEQLGIRNLVIAPRRLDRDCTGVQNDSRDARELAMDLDRWVRGNPKALRPVYVPTPEQEQRRQQSRQRDQILSHRRRLASQGRTLLLGQGWVESNFWWRPARWEELSGQLPEWLRQALEVLRRLILAVNQELQGLTQAVESRALATRPKGLGALSLEVMRREVCDWKRLKSRKAVGSYAGLVGGVSSTGSYHCDLSLTKAGNRRLRTVAVEAAWRWVIHQPQCPRIQQWRQVLLNPRAHKRVRKRAIVAVARGLLVDLWRWETGRADPRTLGWVMIEGSARQA